MALSRNEHLSFTSSASTVPFLKTTFKVFYTLKGIPVKQREEAEKMAGIIILGIVEDDKILVRTAAMDIDS